jgi:hypothetical protein
MSQREWESTYLSEQGNGHGELTSLVCLDALNEADHELERARLRCTKAAAVLSMCRDRLSEAVARAYPQQAFGPIKTSSVRKRLP